VRHIGVNPVRLFPTLHGVARSIIRNIDDGSYSVSPELIYTGVSNLGLRLKAYWLQSDLLSESGEKRNHRRIEFRLRYAY
jgi:hypothetical protein